MNIAPISVSIYCRKPFPSRQHATSKIKIPINLCARRRGKQTGLHTVYYRYNRTARYGVAAVPVLVGLIGISPLARVHFRTVDPPPPGPTLARSSSLSFSFFAAMTSQSTDTSFEAKGQRESDKKKTQRGHACTRKISITWSVCV